MAFGQHSGPPASASQVRELLALLNNAGHRTFREARGPMGLSQRQGSGNFTRDEATEFIDRLQDAEFAGTPAAVHASPRLSAAEQMLRRMPAEELAAELHRRGWTTSQP